MYPYPNQSFQTVAAAADIFQQHGAELDQDSALFVGDVLNAGGYKAAHTDAPVHTVEANKVTALFQRVQIDMLAGDAKPKDARQAAFISPRTDASLPDEWEDDGYSELTVPENDLNRIRDRYKSVAAEDDAFSMDPVNSLFEFPGRFFNPYPAHDSEGRRNVSYKVHRKEDIYPHILEQFEVGCGVKRPDTIATEPIEKTGQTGDIVYANNVPDWMYEDHGSFDPVVDALQQAVGDSGFVWFYSSPQKSLDEETVWRSLYSADVGVSDVAPVDEEVGRMYVMRDFPDPEGGEIYRDHVPISTDPAPDEGQAYLFHLDTS
ncbi:MAG: hypothetical protein SVY41_02990 [Candidatus Nanohaloarchaea archaeon]|nr:hypothetical protein [Candidatus Nanohaloarchaea archaeon]